MSDLAIHPPDALPHVAAESTSPVELDALELKASPMGVAKASLAIGLAGAIAGSALQAPVLGLTTALGAGVLAPALATPALLVCHAFLGLRSPTESVTHAIGVEFERLGTVAMGLGPLLLFFSLSTQIAPALAIAMLWGAGLVSLGRLVGELWSLEMSCTQAVDDREHAQQRHMVQGLLVMSWSCLVMALSLRILFIALVH